MTILPWVLGVGGILVLAVVVARRSQTPPGFGPPRGPLPGDGSRTGSGPGAHQDLAFPAPPAGTTIDSIASLLASGRRIEAIKAWREKRHVGLREAKEAVEALQRNLPPR